MKNIWYSDDRDLIKWSALIHIARTHRIKKILQVPYLQLDNDYPNFYFEEERLEIIKEVWQFFRNIHHIISLGKDVGVSINIVLGQFIPQHRDAYISEVKTHIEQAKRPLILFLDPDTGLQPQRCGPEHVSFNEIKKFWSFLKPSEWLVLYQHARRSPQWAEDAAKQLSSLCNGSSIKIARSIDVGKDVAFLCAEKSETA